MANCLTILAREFDKFYDKKCNFKDAITLMTQQLRNEAERFKEKVYLDEKAQSLKDISAQAKNIDKPFSMIKVGWGQPDSHRGLLGRPRHLHPLQHEVRRIAERKAEKGKLRRQHLQEPARAPHEGELW